MKFSIANCTKEDINTIDDALGNYNIAKMPAVLDFIWKPLNFGIYDTEGVLVGGILGGVGGWGGLEIKILWVREELRRKGLGAQLLKHMEVEGKKLGAWKAQLDTFSFQAKDFYLNQGYEVFGVLKDFPKGHERIFFYKDI